MMKLSISILLLQLLTIGSSAQQKFSLDNASKKYSVVILVDTCYEGTCEGKGIIKLADKNTRQLFQTFTSGNLYFFLDSTQRPSFNINELYDEQSPLIFDDFNFDGSEDLAIRNGNNSGYGGPSYDIYVYNKTRKQFVRSKELTKLASENLGMFQTDHKKKRLVTFQKSGCCWHATNEYEVIPRKGLIKVYELTEDESNGKFVIVTTRKLINNKWTKTVKKTKKAEDR